ncbi:hypothetical protein M0812_13267 [Anaeramoeba flamelloides]|uniref:Uncharacterized protein n=1 Tax=Anaeramoeba flamelloides TaxID=1746091 RepID=A0AAV7ZJJ8_9EUKA|nr:hypothetical protein M0812_13267 [Anaeramoeba flamelloides]
MQFQLNRFHKNKDSQHNNAKFYHKLNSEIRNLFSWFNYKNTFSIETKTENGVTLNSTNSLTKENSEWKLGSKLLARYKYNDLVSFNGVFTEANKLMVNIVTKGLIHQNNRSGIIVKNKPNQAICWSKYKNNYLTLAGRCVIPTLNLNFSTTTKYKNFNFGVNGNVNPNNFKSPNFKTTFQYKPNKNLILALGIHNFGEQFNSSIYSTLYPKLHLSLHSVNYFQKDSTKNDNLSFGFHSQLNNKTKIKGTIEKAGNFSILFATELFKKTNFSLTTSVNLKSKKRLNEFKMFFGVKANLTI